MESNIIGKHVNIKQIVSLYVRNTRLINDYEFVEVSKIKWKIFPFWFERLKSWKWKYIDPFSDDQLDTIEDVINHAEMKWDEHIRYDEKEGQFYEKPYIRIEYIDKTTDKISFDSTIKMQNFFEKLREKLDLLKIEYQIK